MFCLTCLGGLSAQALNLIFMKRVPLYELRLGTIFKLFPDSSHSYTLLRNDGEDSLVLHRGKDKHYFPMTIPSEITVYIS